MRLYLERFSMSTLLLQRLVKPAVAAEFLGLTPGTLAKKRMSGEGPRFLKLGGAVRYDSKDLEDYIAKSIRCSTSDEGAR